MCFRIFALMLFFKGYSASYETYYAEDYCGDDRMLNTLHLHPIQSRSAAVLQGKRKGSGHFDQLCTIILSPPEGYGINIEMNHLDFPKAPSNDCQNYIKVFNISSKEPRPICGQFVLGAVSRLLSSEGEVHILYRTVQELANDTAKDVIDFQLTFSAFAKEDVTGDPSDTFRCFNGQYIWSPLQCDGNANCADASDENRSACQGFLDEKRDRVILMASGIVMGLMILSFILMLFFLSKNLLCRWETPSPTLGVGSSSPTEIIVLRNLNRIPEKGPPSPQNL